MANLALSSHNARFAIRCGTVSRSRSEIFVIKVRRSSVDGIALVTLSRTAMRSRSALDSESAT
ncbi:hypothetical protein D3C83_288650 [compost metagenome]